jgi:hypothetical protein
MIAYEDGIFRSTKYLPRSESLIGPSQLVLIRTDGQFGPASVLLPQANTFNRWSFNVPGIKLTGEADEWGKALMRLPHEGFYRLRKEMVFAEDNKWLEGAILQLGYNRRGEPLLFIAKRRKPLVENDLFFESQGLKVDDEWLDQLDALAWHEPPD